MKGTITQMSVSGQPDPRANQKRRTRRAIVEAGTALMAQGVTPTIARVADAAEVSRATAYRYFPTQDALLTEILDVSPPVAPVDAAVAVFSTEEPETRVTTILDLFVPAIIEHEGQYRAAVRTYLDSWFESHPAAPDPAPILREGRRLRWIDDALASMAADLSPQTWSRLRAGLSLVISMESIFVLKDICEFTDDEVLDALQWSAAAILRAASNETSNL